MRLCTEKPVFTSARRLALACRLFSQLELHSRGKQPYDDKLMRLSEILGTVHYLRELCMPTTSFGETACGADWRRHHSAAPGPPHPQLPQRLSGLQPHLPHLHAVG